MASLLRGRSTRWISTGVGTASGISSKPASEQIVSAFSRLLGWQLVLTNSTVWPLSFVFSLESPLQVAPASRNMSHASGPSVGPNHQGPPLLIYTVGLLCALAAAVFATTVRGFGGVLALSVGFLMGMAWLAPAPGWTGAVVGMMAVLMLVGPHWASVWLAAPVASGLTGGLWSQMLAGYGLPAWLAWLLAGGVMAVSAIASQRDPRFARPAVREDALVALAVLGVAVAAAPGVTAGWRTAETMNLAGNDMLRSGTSPGILLGLAAVLSLGGIHTLWRRG